MSADDKPKAALEEACDIIDAFLTMTATDGDEQTREWEDLRKRRDALQPRLDKLRENQAKPRGNKEPKS